MTSTSWDCENVAVNPAEREARRAILQAAIDAERSLSERNKRGQFATPIDLAREIASCIRRDWPEHVQGIRFSDPAIGTGSFYSAAVSVFGADAIQSAIGIELDSRFARAAGELWGESGLQIFTGDFTRIVAEESRPPGPNLILANPPYVRHHHLSREDKARLQRVTARLCHVDVNGLAGLYVYFVLLATAWMADGGAAAWLIPSEFMDVNYGHALKSYLTDQVTLERIHRFDPNDVQFGDALVSSVILFFRKLSPNPDHAVTFTFGGSLERPAATATVATSELRAAHKWTIYPQHAQNDRRVSAAAGRCLSDFFQVQRGIATGSNSFFIMERKAATRLGFHSLVRPILPSPRHLKVTVIESDEDGYPLLDPQLCLIDCGLDESIVQVRHPELWNYLQTAESLGVRNSYLVGKRMPWYKQEQRTPAPFLCTYMGRGSGEKRPFRFIWNRSEAIGTNLYLMLYPKTALARMLGRHPERAAELFAWLNEISGHELRGEGRVYGGGLNKIEPRELGRISADSLVERFPELVEAPRPLVAKSLFD